MITFEEALKEILRKTKRLEIEELPLVKTKGYVLAENIKAKLDMPPFDKSAMDGYALRSDDLKSVPEKLKCVGIIKAGGGYKKTVKKGECVKIMTGSPLPKGTNGVVMVERTSEDEKRGWIKVLQSIRAGENVCFKGEDIKKGTVVLRKGMLIRETEVSIASSQGRTKVRVYKKPSLAILNTGDEIVEPGNNLTYGKIYNSNGPMLLALLQNKNIKVQYLGIAADKEKSLMRLMRQGLKSDIFLLSGGVSMGDYDLVPEVLKQCGVKEVFHKIQMKPGKPVFFGTKGEKLVFGVPGNPVSTYLTFLVLIKPALDKMMGKTPPLHICRGRLKEDFRQKPGRKHFVPAKVLEEKGQLHVYPVKKYHGSADIASLSQANAFMAIEGKFSFLKKDSLVEIILW
ncbi:MAG: molybdopterin molybdotransferase MoeA [Nitrospirae bacterium]|nr:molybdopterin molybdotransferase MoeA [Nitrospirota bacterium]